MEIRADKQIALVSEAFAPFGRVRTFEGRALTAAALEDADVLLVRSVTRVDAALLEGTRVRFVGTSTAGVDHVDTGYLAARGIRFASAPGCNADAVAEHVVACILAHAWSSGRDFRDLEVAIIGFGRAGRALGRMLGRLGIRFVVNDPPLGSRIAGQTVISLDEALAADVVTLHVPLTSAGAHPTRELIDARRVASLADGALLVNAARGGVVDEAALAQRCAGGFHAAVDCWVGEPSIDAALLRHVWRGTPHIAGHTLEARVEASRMLHRALNDFAGTSHPFPDPREREQAVLRGDVETVLERVLPLERHTRRLRRLLALPPADRAAEYDAMRSRHGLRRAFSHYAIASEGLAPDTVAMLRAMGFTILPGSG